MLVVVWPAAAHHQLPDLEPWPEYPLTVGPASLGAVEEAADVWNRLAGRQLFTVVEAVDTETDVFVSYTSTGVSAADPRWTDEDGRLHCSVSLAHGGTNTLVHELGHCLGFADHLYGWQYERQKGNGPAVCDDPDHPAFSNYEGIMSYCHTHIGLSDEDITLARGVESDPLPEGPGEVVAIVNGSRTADALLAATLDVDILLVTRDTIPAPVAAALDNYSRAFIVGGTDVVSEAVAGELFQSGLTVERLGGPDRYATAVEVARRNDTIGF